MPPKRHGQGLAPPLAPPSRKAVIKGGVQSEVSPNGTRTYELTLAHDESEWQANADSVAREEAAALDAMLGGDAASPVAPAKADPRALAAKYGVDIDLDDFDDDDSDDGGGGAPPSGSPRGGGGGGDGAKFEGEFDWDGAGLQRVQQLTLENERLHADASVKAGQVKKLGMLLEALEPLPGLDPDKLLDVMEGAKPEHEIDFRDAKASTRDVAPSSSSSRARAAPAPSPACLHAPAYLTPLRARVRSFVSPSHPLPSASPRSYTSRRRAAGSRSRSTRRRRRAAS